MLKRVVNRLTAQIFLYWNIFEGCTDGSQVERNIAQQNDKWSVVLVKKLPGKNLLCLYLQYEMISEC